MLPDGMNGKDVKFLGIVQTYDEARKHGLVACDEAYTMFNQELYVYKDVLETIGATVGDTIRFGIHLNTRGQPQVSLPIWKVGEDLQPIDVQEGTPIFNAEEYVAADANFLDAIKQDIEDRSYTHNQKRESGKSAGAKGGCKGGGPPNKFQRIGEGPAAQGGFQWGDNRKQTPLWGSQSGMGSPPAGRQVLGRAPAGKGDYGGNNYGNGNYGGGGGMRGGGKGGYDMEATIYVGGLPPGVHKREVAHIFRQYAGFKSVSVVQKEDHSIAFAVFTGSQEAQYAIDTLAGYIFDEEAPPSAMNCLTCVPAKNKTRM